MSKTKDAFSSAKKKNDFVSEFEVALLQSTQDTFAKLTNLDEKEMTVLSLDES